MTDIPKVSNEKNWLTRGLLQTILILAMAVFIIVDKVVPEASGGQREAVATEKRLATLEECVQSLRPLPYDMAAVKTSIQSIEKQIDKIEKKLDSRR